MSPEEIAFTDALHAARLSMHKGSLIADGQLHRYRVDGDKAGSTNGWYVLHLDDKPFGAFGSWRTGQSETWTASAIQTMTAAERKAMVSLAKAKVSRSAKFVGQNAIQTHGGIGITQELAIGHYFKRATLIEGQFGSADYHYDRFERLVIDEAA
jgi:phage/plasmid primase-like uncharacterized protein